MNDIIKHIVFQDWYIDIRSGGPVGYLANLRYGLDRIDNPSDYMIWMMLKNKSECISPVKNNKLSNPKVERLFRYFNTKHIDSYLGYVRKIENYFLNNKNIDYIKNNNISSFHCHTTADALKVINSLEYLKRNDIPVILTSHCPEEPAKELSDVEAANNTKKSKVKELYQYLKKIDELAFKKSNIWIFPSKEAMEPYHETIENFKYWAQDKDIRFLPTGAKQLQSDLSQEEAKIKYDIKKFDFICVYIGRHNEAKGYDRLKEAAKRIQKIDKSILFLIGGKEGPLPTLKQKNWKEIGWISDPQNLMRAGDLFILPNKQTYFDLILIECLSIGIPVLASNTGGNKSVAEMTNAIELYDTSIDELVEKIIQLKNNKNRLKTLKDNSLSSYNKLFTPMVFAENYKILVEKVLKDYGRI